jgi:hypothetical protein
MLHRREINKKSRSNDKKIVKSMKVAKKVGGFSLHLSISTYSHVGAETQAKSGTHFGKFPCFTAAQ